jgi:site-specific DNA-methyltransferase (adenine-specific)
MSYLINLITPPKGIVLDPFMGSGSTGVAAYQNGFEFIGIEKEEEYYIIANKRIQYAVRKESEEVEGRFKWLTGE